MAVSGAGAGHPPLFGDAPVYERRADGVADADRRADPDRYADGIRPAAGDEIDSVGYGAGDRDLTDTPNVVRVLIGEAESGPPTGPAMHVTVLECEIDDMNPQIFGVVMENLYAAGALEVFYSAGADEEEPAGHAA